MSCANYISVTVICLTFCNSYIYPMITYKQIGGKNSVTNRCLNVLIPPQKPRYRTLKIFRGVDYRTPANDGESPQDRYKYS